MIFTACYTRLQGEGYLGQLLEWPGIITDGKNIEECRAMLIDAAQEMAKSYIDDNKKSVKKTPFFLETLSVPLPSSLLEESELKEENEAQKTEQKLAIPAV